MLLFRYRQDKRNSEQHGGKRQKRQHSDFNYKLYSGNLGNGVQCVADFHESMSSPPFGPPFVHQQSPCHWPTSQPGRPLSALGMNSSTGVPSRGAVSIFSQIASIILSIGEP